ncbi:PREDICTED: alpha-(1,3)-fucosyltransferase C-like [Priapulus caudatus]|uniref:Fucosyltransferase n=1 Tax=Priapulus caudatus TaxID=37621 RepID=A0ABM1EIQ7_PRICU|nr:PREDICTED: alpha-(1,3)-fucosyltransferase C-like [Priapulus caudatus]XP_014672077.1 PREDICTED: alpha-(1,3)-fucosyltransferase C-like [Priapulus caudatus]XP_014672078.1 PREDICTED: alpha-(1,3)-fucosyltransferase C-like [Priapulus caudatus]XP_014672079.1 PREDICTED: alpha-(1,3)-fucosyltransferase C-like [Priapulus caudatus]
MKSESRQRAGKSNKSKHPPPKQSEDRHNMDKHNSKARQQSNEFDQKTNVTFRKVGLLLLTLTLVCSTVLLIGSYFHSSEIAGNNVVQSCHRGLSDCVAESPSVMAGHINEHSPTQNGIDETSDDDKHLLARQSTSDKSDVSEHNDATYDESSIEVTDTEEKNRTSANSDASGNEPKTNKQYDNIDAIDGAAGSKTGVSDERHLTSPARSPVAGATFQPIFGGGGDIKRILFWTPMFRARDWDVGVGRRAFDRCAERRCETVVDRALLLSSDAVLFHMRDVRRGDVPAARSPRQKWVFALKESPWYSWAHRFTELRDAFNWTMTYRRDSDVPWLYGEFRHKGAPADRGEFPREGAPVRGFAAGKTKLVAWFASRCNAISESMRYVDELRRHLPVDVYGACGPLRCPRSESARCYAMLARDYKFYLAFENSVCRDYVTEKLFLAMNASVVPVVLGGADYRRHLPPRSYIDVRDFASPRDLARHLAEIDGDDARYNEYFAWRSDFELATLTDNANAICGLCAKLHGDDGVRVSSYEDVHAWWNRTADCEKGIYELLDQA